VARYGIHPQLRRWTAWHEEWEEEVASVAFNRADGLIFFDPLDPSSDLGRPEHVLLTVFWHGRSAADVGAAHIWASSRSARPLGNRGINVTDVFRAGDELPAGIQALQTARANEVVFWLPEQRTVVVGDVLLGAGARPRPTQEALRLCPERWLGKGTHDELRESLQPLLELPVERVLPGHGDPVLTGGKDALRKVLS
jgi:glyoxylase-like metal-dependent hydrolase (beta-lactamase superfamily II)